MKIITTTSTYLLLVVAFLTTRVQATSIEIVVFTDYDEVSEVDEGLPAWMHMATSALGTADLMALENILEESFQSTECIDEESMPNSFEITAQGRAVIDENDETRHRGLQLAWKPYVFKSGSDHCSPYLQPLPFCGDDGDYRTRKLATIDEKKCNKVAKKILKKFRKLDSSPFLRSVEGVAVVVDGDVVGTA